jgi:hypothetical protein
MWYAITALPRSRSKKESSKEYFSGYNEIVLSAKDRISLENKLNESCNKYPKHMRKYLSAGIKIVEARNKKEAKIKAKDVFIYFNEKGQYSFI